MEVSKNSRSDDYSYTLTTSLEEAASSSAPSICYHNFAYSFNVNTPTSADFTATDTATDLSAFKFPGYGKNANNA